MKSAVYSGIGLAVFVSATIVTGAAAQTATAAPQAAASADAAHGVALPVGYVMGPGDILSVVFWRDKDLSAEVVVRPDGKISLPLLNDMSVAGLTPEQFRKDLIQAASKYVESPNATVVVKQINSRKVFITGNIGKPGEYPLTGDLKVLQLIALAGGLQEYADSDNILVIRNQGGSEPKYLKFNYRDVLKMKNVQQNISLNPGDTVVVP